LKYFNWAGAAHGSRNFLGGRSFGAR